ncbi:MAG: hypothetical protein PF545_00615 [Elusimicrobia bacterium]|jgi:hypothetical protein|nr:hypothetical protein [Elusimicrobiota bacterium]
MKKLILIILAVFVHGTGNIYGESSPLSDKYYIGEVPGADAIGRGGAFAGAMGSPFAPYWNPAGLAVIKNNRLGVAANILSDSKIDSSIIKKIYALEDRNLNFISVAAPQVAVYWRKLSDRVDISSYTEPGGIEVKTVVDEKLNQFGVSVSIANTERTYFGMNINYLTGILGYSKVRGSTVSVVISDGYGWGLDWGLIFDVSERLNVGLTLLNGPAVIYWEDYSSESLPLIFRGGLDLKMSNLMTLGIDYENGVYDDSVKSNDILHVGIEHYISQNFVLRGGMSGNDLSDKNKTTYSAGIGYKEEGYSVDLSAIQYCIKQQEYESVRRFSISGVYPF